MGLGFFIKGSGPDGSSDSHAGARTTLARWLERIPADLQIPHPLLPVLGALAHALTGRTDKAGEILARVPPDAIAANPALAARVDLVHAMVAAQHEDSADLVQTIARIPEHLLTERIMRQARLTALLLGLTSRGLYDEAHQTFATYPVAQHELADEMMLIAESVLLVAHWYSGDCAATIRCGEDLLARAEAAHGRRSISACVCAALLAAARYEADNIEAARELLANRMDMLERSTPETAMQATLCGARVDVLEGNLKRARDYLKSQHAHFVAAGFARATAAVLGLRVDIELQAGTIPGAVAACDALADHARRHPDIREGAGEIAAIAARARAAVCLATGQLDEALTCLDQAHGSYERLRRTGRLVDCDLLAARIHTAIGSTRAANDALSRALAAGARLGMVRTFIEHGPELVQRLTALAGTGDLSDEMLTHARLIIARASSTSGSRAAAGHDAVTEHSSLTPRELEVLRMLDQSMSTKRIALILGISPNIVKWNVKNIFGKLGVNTRYAALAHARQRQLI